MLFVSYRYVPGDICKGGVFDQFMSQEKERCDGANGRKTPEHKGKTPSQPDSGGDSEVAFPEFVLLYGCLV